MGIGCNWTISTCHPCLMALMASTPIHFILGLENDPHYLFASTILLTSIYIYIYKRVDFKFYIKIFFFKKQFEYDVIMVSE